jgi:hypothetical protein
MRSGTADLGESHREFTVVQDVGSGQPSECPPRLNAEQRARERAIPKAPLSEHWAIAQRGPHRSTGVQVEGSSLVAVLSQESHHVDRRARLHPLELQQVGPGGAGGPEHKAGGQRTQLRHRIVPVSHQNCLAALRTLNKPAQVSLEFRNPDLSIVVRPWSSGDHLSTDVQPCSRPYQIPSAIFTSSLAIVRGSQGGFQTMFTSTSFTPGISFIFA